MPAWVAPAVIAGASIAGGLLGSSSANKASKRAAAMQREAAGYFDALDVPTAEELYVQLEDMVRQGQITPEMAQTIMQEKSAMEEVKMGGGGRDAQYAALEELRNISGEGGLTATDRSKIMEIQDQLATTGRGARQAVTQEMAERGVAGSGLDYMDRLMAAQSGAETAARQGTDVAAMAEQRALQAIMAQGELGGQITGQEFGEQSDIAKAKDMISQFNAANRQSIELENTRARNLSQQQNLAEQQRLAELNATQRNMEKLRRSDLAQQEFENQLAKTSGKAAAMTGAAQAQMQRAQSQQDMYGRLIGAGGQIIGATAPYWGSGSSGTSNTANVSGYGKVNTAPSDYWKTQGRG